MDSTAGGGSPHGQLEDRLAAMAGDQFESGTRNAMRDRLLTRIAPAGDPGGSPANPQQLEGVARRLRRLPRPALSLATRLAMRVRVLETATRRQPAPGLSWRRGRPLAGAAATLAAVATALVAVLVPRGGLTTGPAVGGAVTPPPQPALSSPTGPQNAAPVSPSPGESPGAETAPASPPAPVTAAPRPSAATPPSASHAFGAGAASTPPPASPPIAPPPPATAQQAAAAPPSGQVYSWFATTSGSPMAVSNAYPSTPLFGEVLVSQPLAQATAHVTLYRDPGGPPGPGAPPPTPVKSFAAATVDPGHPQLLSVEVGTLTGGRYELDVELDTSPSAVAVVDIAEPALHTQIVPSGGTTPVTAYTVGSRVSGRITMESGVPSGTLLQTVADADGNTVAMQSVELTPATVTVEIPILGGLRVGTYTATWSLNGVVISSENFDIVPG
jgi:hypothetical protein